MCQSFWRAFLKDVDEAQQLDWSEAFIGKTFAPSKNGALVSVVHAGVMGQSLSYWSTARVFLSECTFRLPIEPSRNSRRKRSPK